MATVVRAVGAALATGVALAALLRLSRWRRSGPIALDDETWIAMAHAERLRRKRRPSQSGFRVVAVVVYRYADGALRHVVGHNDEASNLLNSCCAERAAFLQLAGLAREAAGELEVLGVYITTDASHALTPGALCREYMSSSTWTSMHETRIVMEGTLGRPSRLERTLAQLYPHPSVYTRLERTDQDATGRRLAESTRGARERATGREGTAWRAAVAACARDARHDLHPISYGSCVVFEDGVTAVAWQKKALEYSCSLDAVCQLCQAIEERADASKPAIVCMADQHGVCHAPCATARAYLTEHGCGKVRVLLHDESGELRAVSAEELLPALPAWCS